MNKTTAIKTRIHPRAMVHPEAQLGEGVYIGPYSVIENDVVLGDGTEVLSNAIVHSGTRLGRRNRIFHGAVICNEPQDLKFRDEKSYFVAGDDNIFREYCTMSRATEAGGKTVVGSGNLFMAYSHIGHNCIIGDRNILANSVSLAGHVELENNVTIGGLSGVHQFVRIGRFAFIGGCSRITQDIIPFTRCSGNIQRVAGINTIGLQRAGVPEEARMVIKRAYKLIYRRDLTISAAVGKIRSELPAIPEISAIIDFLEKSERGIAREKTL